MNADEYFTNRIYNEGCLVRGSREECKSCDGFGNNPDNKINTYMCYTSKKLMEEDLRINIKNKN
ncbi:MAG: hypothetical protein ACP5NZ_00445 [Nanobdellota archaeon]